MRVAFLIDRWQPGRGGAERALELFAQHLVAREHEVHAFGLVGPRRGEEAPGSFHRVRARALGRGARERRFAEAALAAAEEAGCDVTLGVRHLPRVDLYWPHGGSHAETLAALGKRARGRHLTFLELERELLDRGGARRVACVSRLVRDELARRHPACVERLRLVPNGVDLARFRPEERAAARERLRARLPRAAPRVLVGFAGRNGHLKGLDVLLRAASELEDLPWMLVAAGPRRLRPWQRMAANLRIPAERLFLSSDLPALELAAGVDLAVLPSRRDPAPLFVLEALACGTPVLASARAGTSECIRAGAGEVLDEPEDAGALRASLARWIERALEGDLDPAVARACVADRGLAGWMEAMEALLLEAAGAPEQP